MENIPNNLISIDQDITPRVMQRLVTITFAFDAAISPLLHKGHLKNQDQKINYFALLSITNQPYQHLRKGQKWREAHYIFKLCKHS